MEETTLDEDAVPSEQDLRDLSQLINSIYLSEMVLFEFLKSAKHQDFKAIQALIK